MPRQARPINAIAAIVVALLPIPVLRLVDHFNRGCGDGLCGFFSGILLLAGLVVTLLVLLRRSATRDEQPWYLRLVPLPLLLLALYPMFI